MNTRVYEHDLRGALFVAQRMDDGEVYAEAGFPTLEQAQEWALWPYDERLTAAAVWVKSDEKEAWLCYEPYGDLLAGVVGK